MGFELVGPPGDLGFNRVLLFLDHFILLSNCILKILSGLLAAMLCITRRCHPCLAHHHIFRRCVTFTSSCLLFQLFLHRVNCYHLVCNGQVFSLLIAAGWGHVIIIHPTGVHRITLVVLWLWSPVARRKQRIRLELSWEWRGHTTTCFTTPFEVLWEWRGVWKARKRRRRDWKEVLFQLGGSSTRKKSHLDFFCTWRIPGPNWEDLDIRNLGTKKSKFLLVMCQFAPTTVGANVQILFKNGLLRIK